MAKPNMDITQDRLRELLRYEESTGLFFWRSSHCNVKAGQVAGALMPGGYVRIKLRPRSYAAHRLAWLYVHGRLPVAQIDHINRVRSDNRICNLREATNAENQQNIAVKAPSGFRGVHWNKRQQKWTAKIGHQGQKHYLGSFSQFDDAVRAYKKAAASLQKFNPCAEGSL